MNPIEMFKQMAVQQYGQNLNPKTMVLNLLGQDGNTQMPQTPQQALLQLYQSGRITQQQYEQYLRMM